MKTDSKAIQAIHDHVITHNPRVWVSKTDESTWNLHIKNVQEDDRGQYMCQINTDPMISQVSLIGTPVNNHSEKYSKEFFFRTSSIKIYDDFSPPPFPPLPLDQTL